MKRTIHLEDHIWHWQNIALIAAIFIDQLVYWQRKQRKNTFFKCYKSSKDLWEYYFSNGPEWWRLRSEIQKEISAPKNVRSFLTQVDEITKEFLEYLPKNETVDILPKLTRLNLERKYICMYLADNNEYYMKAAF